MSITDIELINFEIKRISSSVSLCLELEWVGVYEFITSSTICMTSVSYKLKCQCLNCVISGPGSGTINSQDDFEHFIQRSGSGPYYCQLCSYNNKQFAQWHHILVVDWVYLIGWSKFVFNSMYKLNTPTGTSLEMLF